MNIAQLKLALPLLDNAQVTPLIVGAHGIGKSQAIAQYCQEQAIGFVDLRLGQMGDVGDLMGLPITKDNAVDVVTRFARPAWFPTSGRGIIFLDEINRARKDVHQGSFQLILDRRIGEHVLPLGWHVVAACNPNDAEYSVTDISDKAFQDRFCHIGLEPSREEFFAFGRSVSFPEAVQAFLADQPDLIEMKPKTLELDRTPSRRSWAAAARILNANPPEDIKYELIAGLVGTKACAAYLAFSKSFEMRISADDVLNKYETVKTKVLSLAERGRMDALSAITAELVEVLTPLEVLPAENAAQLEEFLMDLPKDLGFAFSRDVLASAGFRAALGESKALIKHFKVYATAVAKKTKKAA